MVIARNERIADEGHIGIRETEHWITLIRFRFDRLALRFFGESVRGPSSSASPLDTISVFSSLPGARAFGFSSDILIYKPWGFV